MKKITDLFGVEHTWNEPRFDEPSQAWVEGWECCMHDGWKINPYEAGDDEYSDWQAGYEAAERD